jgi:PDZ domain-containing secreted protein
MMNFFKDTWLLFMRHLKKTMREPMWLLIGLMQPVLYLLLYMPLLKNMPGDHGEVQSMVTVVGKFTPASLRGGW